MHLLLWGSFALFAFFGLKITLEEDIIKLLPREAINNELAFSKIEIKDKAFLQITSSDAENPATPEALGAGMEEFCDMLQAADTSGQYIRGILHTLDLSLALDAMDFGLAHLPSFVDTSYYAGILEAMEPEAIDSMMAQNYNTVMSDMTGFTSQMAAMDPIGIRNVVLEELFPEGMGALGGYSLVDGHIMCPDKTVALAFLTPNFAATNSGVATRFIKMLNRVAGEFEAKHPDMKVYTHGDVMTSVSNSKTMKTDLALTVGISFLIILIIILFSFHRFSFVFQQILPVVYGTFFSLSCMYWIKGYMSLMALGVSALVLGVAISYCLHVLIHYYYVIDAEAMLRDESTPVFLGCLTTIGAFMGLLFTESDLLRDFGLFSTFALIGSTFFALVFLPHFLHPSQIKFKRTHGFPLVERINRLPWDRNIWVIIILLVLITIGLVFSPKVKFDSDLRNLNYEMPEYLASKDLYNLKNADGATHMYFAAHHESSLDKALEYNKGLGLALDSLKASGLVKGYSPITELLLVPESVQEERIAAWKEFWSPERVAGLSKALAASAKKNGLPADFAQPFIALLTQDYEPGNLVESGIVPPGLLSNYVEQQEGGRYMVFTDVAFDMADKDNVIKALTAEPNVLVIEPFYYCRDMVEIIHDDFNTTLLISSAFVLLVLLISFRNIWIALLAFLPMGISWYVLQGYMALFGLEFNLINIVISTFIFGIGVDYSIFVMEGLLSEAREGVNNKLAYHKVAIVFSAMVLAIVTFSLIFATHPSLKSIGWITLIGMASTILITYSLQPYVFRRLAKIPYFRRSFRIPD
jgi:predicted RND superfamily exporter protein